MKNFSRFFLALALAIATVDSRKLVPSLSILKEFIVESGSLSWDIYEGLILGLQENRDNLKHQCFISFNTLKGDIQKMPHYINGISDSTKTENSIVSTLTSNPWN